MSGGLRPAVVAQLGDRIRAARQQQELSVGALAELSEVSRRMLTQIELGQANPSVAIAVGSGAMPMISACASGRSSSGAESGCSRTPQPSNAHAGAARHPGARSTPVPRAATRASSTACNPKSGRA